jgi:hypothetical protein
MQGTSRAGEAGNRLASGRLCGRDIGLNDRCSTRRSRSVSSSGMLRNLRRAACQAAPRGAGRMPRPTGDWPPGHRAEPALRGEPDRPSLRRPALGHPHARFSAGTRSRVPLDRSGARGTAPPAAADRRSGIRSPSVGSAPASMARRQASYSRRFQRRSRAAPLCADGPSPMNGARRQ